MQTPGPLSLLRSFTPQRIQLRAARTPQAPAPHTSQHLSARTLQAPAAPDEKKSPPGGKTSSFLTYSAPIFSSLGSRGAGPTRTIELIILEVFQRDRTMSELMDLGPNDETICAGYVTFSKQATPQTPPSSLNLRPAPAPAGSPSRRILGAAATRSLSVVRALV